MLATFGFIATGLCFAAFAYTFDSLVLGKTKLNLHNFSRAYYSIALAMLTWGVAASTKQSIALEQSVIIGDALLLIGTLFMLDIWLGKKNRQWLWVAVLVAATLLYERVTLFPPSPYMEKGILVFNTNTEVVIVLGLLFLVVWLPVSLKVARKVTHAVKQDSIYRIYSSVYILSAISALLFLNARRLITTVITFAVIGICFLLLIQSNILVAELKDRHHGK